jgi:CheY-like chemotaxis protein
LNIIYIDDDATSRALLRDMLATRGLNLTEAADARTGLKMIEAGKFDLILMDLRMPDMNGLTAIRQLRSGGNQRERIPIVVVTADPSEGVRELCRSAGADDFLEKPVDMEKLFATVAAARRKNPAGS